MQSLEYFSTQPFINALKAFFKELNIPINYIADEPATPGVILGDKWKHNIEAHSLIDEVYALGMVNDAIFEGRETYQDLEEIRKFDKDYDGLLIFGVTLKDRRDNLPISRSQLAEITRAFNRAFPYTPVTIVFKYSHYISFANSERIPYKQSYREGDKVGKVSLLRDIDLQCTHRGHKDILNDLKIQSSGKNAVNSFASLYKYWQEVFSVSILNKRFYKELQNWYFWAIKEVTFPNSPNRFDYESDEKFDEAVKEHKGKNVIRLLTRILFIWFIKEKGLIPEQLFDEKVIADKLIKDFTPQKPQGVFATGKNSSTYYRAILQNLFFATLNQEMGKRTFRSDGQHQNVTNLMRYKSYFKDPDYFVLLMEEVVPFMNGGLFECLDKPHPTLKGKQGGDVVIYNDGFSDRDDNPLTIPDYLFFDVDEEVDLSDDFGNKVFKNSKTRGLIEILESYKFTITENTPIEEDVALDPELLGKVFENLLASYNPETKTTARKQTGSFYTPREIVNYMVDESLIAYLKNKITEWNVSEEKLDEQLHQLLSYDNSNPFSVNQNLQSQIIKALDQCTILDPACGSGAFPMGILQKMVHVLHQVDPNNTEWKQRQIDRVTKAIENLEEIDDAQFREQSIKELKVQIKDIEDSFENNELDYGRKLYLIENCIYGVDIQSIATQISKLRFFISLIVDQKIDKTKDNFGIRPLPNLETKFVAANTLIDIEKPKAQLNLFENLEVKKLEADLKKVRHKLFSSKSPANKRKLREEDKELRNRISEILVNEGWNNNSARQLASWDPYDQNESSSFFNPEWMFDIPKGFDVVIGNPPYVEFKNLDSEIKKTLIHFKSTSGKYDLYIPFIERGILLLTINGILCFINPTRFLRRDYGNELKRFLLENIYIKEIMDFSDVQIFENALTYTGVFQFSNDKTSQRKTKIKTFSDKLLSSSTKDLNGNSIETTYVSQQELIFSNPWYFKTNLIEEICELIKKNAVELESICDGIFQGISTGKDEVFVINQETINKYKIESEIIKPFLKGKNIAPYSLNWSGNYLIYPYDNDGNVFSESTLKNKYPFALTYLKENLNKLQGRAYFDKSNKLWFELWNQRSIRKFNQKKIMTLDNASQNSFAIDTNNFLGTTTTYSIVLKPNLRSKYEALILQLNSILLNFYHKNNTIPQAGGFYRYQSSFIKGLPIVMDFSETISQILYSVTLKHKNLGSSVSNGVVFELFFKHHMQEREIDVLQFVERDIEKVMQNREFDSLSTEEKEIIIEKLHVIWSNPDNEVIKRINLFKGKSPDILKLILES